MPTHFAWTHFSVVCLEHKRAPWKRKNKYQLLIYFLLRAFERGPKNDYVVKDQELHYLNIFVQISN